MKTHKGCFLSGFSEPRRLARAVIESCFGVAFEEKELFLVEDEGIEHLVVFDDDSLGRIFENVECFSKGLSHETAGLLEKVELFCLFKAVPLSESG